MTTAKKNEGEKNVWDSLGRASALKSEIEALRAKAGELEALKAREEELEKELAVIESALGAAPSAPSAAAPSASIPTNPIKKRRRLGMLEDIRVASPCPANWNEMLGDERVRFCTGCEKNVYNISMMSREEAEDLIAEKEGDLCVRFFQRADGTIMTGDCPVGAKKKLRKKAALAVATAGAMAFAAWARFGDHFEPSNTGPCWTETTATQPQPPPPPPIENTPPTVDPWEGGHWIAGGIGEVQPVPKPVPKPPAPKPRVTR